eukprot:SAG31_NODE_34521_length_332_cov_0.669528_1_plen_51_part_10
MGSNLQTGTFLARKSRRKKLRQPWFTDQSLFGPVRQVVIILMLDESSFSDA